MKKKKRGTTDLLADRAYDRKTAIWYRRRARIFLRDRQLVRFLMNARKKSLEEIGVAVFGAEAIIGRSIVVCWRKILRLGGGSSPIIWHDSDEISIGLVQSLSDLQHGQ